MKHDIAIRASKTDKKEVVVSLNMPDKFEDAKLTESLVTCAYRHAIIRANDHGRNLMKSDDYKSKKIDDEHVKRETLKKFNSMLNDQKYVFRTKGQQMSKVEKTEKQMSTMSTDELEQLIAKAQELQLSTTHKK